MGIYWENYGKTMEVNVFMGKLWTNMGTSWDLLELSEDFKVGFYSNQK